MNKLDSIRKCLSKMGSESASGKKESINAFHSSMEDVDSCPPLAHFVLFPSCYRHQTDCCPFLGNTPAIVHVFCVTQFFGHSLLDRSGLSQGQQHFCYQDYKLAIEYSNSRDFGKLKKIKQGG